MDEYTEEERQLTEQLQHFQPRPSQRAYDRMADTPWSNGSREHPILKLQTLSRPLRLALATLLVAVMAVTVVWITPPLRALAQEVLDSLFNRASSSVVTVETNRTGGVTRNDPPQNIPEVEALAGFTLKQLPSTPAGYTFAGAGYTASRHAASLHYQRPGAGIIITQQPVAYTKYGLLTDGIDGIGPDASIEHVAIGDVSGEYVVGTWIMASDDRAIWLADAPIQRLRWQEGEMLYEIYVGGSTDSLKAPDRDGMIALALSLQ